MRPRLRDKRRWPSPHRRGSGPGRQSRLRNVVISSQQSFQGPASLPQRTRGAADHRPPARVARPVLPESFLERVRAAAEAARREDGQASSDSPAAIVSATTGSAFIAPPREAPATEAPSPGREAPVAEPPPLRPRAAEAPVAEAPVPDAASPVASDALPRRVRGMSDGPQPPTGWPGRCCRSLCWNACGPRSRLTLRPRLRITPRNQPPSRCPAAVRRRVTGPQPHAGVAQPMARPETSSPGANTEPIPVISVTAEPAALAQNAAPSKPEAAPAPPERKPDKKPAGPKAAEVKAAESKAAELKAAGRATPRPAPSTHRTISRDPRTGPGTGRPAQRQARASRSYRVAGVLVATATVGALVLGWAVFHHSGKSAARGSNAGPGSARPAQCPAGRPGRGQTRRGSLGQNSARPGRRHLL